MVINDGNVQLIARAISVVFWLTRSRTAQGAQAGYRRLLTMAHRNTGIKLVRGKGPALLQAGNGHAAEALRRIKVERLKGHMEAFMSTERCRTW